MARVTGTYGRTAVGGEIVAAFLPRALPPSDPPLVLDDESRELLQTAEEALRRLELAGEMVPSLDWFVYGFVRKEAVVSSQIEGTQATLIDLLAFEAQGDAGPRPTATKAVTSLVEAGVLAETSGKRRDRTFGYAAYLDTLKAGTD